MTQNLFLLGEDLQDGFSLLAGRALEVRVDDLAVLDEIRRAMGRARQRVVWHAERRGDSAVVIRDQGEGKVVFVLEGLLRGDVVVTHADDGDALFRKRLIAVAQRAALGGAAGRVRSEEHTSELQSRQYLVCRLL